MSQVIRAFVGHSFTDDDSQPVRAFLDFLTTIQRSQPSFSWVHAESAEPKQVTEKVLALLNDCNLFIAICTRKERAVVPGKLRTSLFRRRLSAEPKELQWKTSDWIIQEIGVAIGRGLKLVLLLEEGVRAPGALQGNLEYIQFNREAPEKSFSKLFQMITASPGNLTTHSDEGSGVVSAPRETTPSELAETDCGQAQVTDKWIPKTGWKRKDYQSAFVNLTMQGDEDSAEKLSEAYLETEAATEVGRREAWLAFRELCRIAYSDKGSLRQLQTLANENPKNSEVLSCLGHGFACYEDHRQAAAAYESAAKNALEAADAIDYYGEAASAWQRANDKPAALAMISAAKEVGRQVGGVDAERQVLLAEQRLATLQDEKEVLLGVNERLLEIDPADASLRFNLAYLHAQAGSAAVAAMHYSRIPSIERSAAAYNNLGVAFEGLAMPAKAISAYRSSEGKGGTLAMSNLANKFMMAGFVAEARALCDRAVKLENYDMNIDKSIVRLKEIPDEEDKREKEVMVKAREISEFYQAFGTALSVPLHADLTANWKGPDCNLVLQISGQHIRLLGEYERPTNLMALGIKPNAAVDSAVTHYRVTYEGTVRGSTIIGVVKREIKGVSSSLLGADVMPTVLLVVSSCGSRISICEKTAAPSHRFYDFTAI